jgi:hypothetical protein
MTEGEVPNNFDRSSTTEPYAQAEYNMKNYMTLWFLSTDTLADMGKIGGTN